MAITHIIQQDRSSPQIVLRCTPEDAAMTIANLTDGPVDREMPGSAEHAYFDRFIVKPWGHEGRIYDDRWMDVWRLLIEPGEATSVHTHPRKDTWLICIGGEGVLETVAGEQIALAEGSIVHIGAGVLHTTRTTHGLSLIEVEAPRDKADLIRIDDRYGRAGDPYEDECASRREPCPLLAYENGPPEARLRKHCGTGCFRFNLETGARLARNTDDLVVAVSLEPSSVLRRAVVVHAAGTFGGARHDELFLTVRSNHR